MPDKNDHFSPETDIQPNRIPEVLLILGTDAAGKNHIANFIYEASTGAAIAIEKREGWFSAPKTESASSENKGPLFLLLEKIFLITFPVTKFLLPLLLDFLIRQDLRSFRKKKDKILVISHTALRILSFYLGHMFLNQDEIRIPRHLDRTLRSIPLITGVQTLVLDISDETRKKRIDRRKRAGKIDNFDRYMAQDSLRSERIEAFLVWLGIQYLNAAVIENNDLSDGDLAREINRAFQKFAITS
ncbi:MAG: hypothetical protein V1706_15635 [Pseudomonadota bacterium]